MGNYNPHAPYILGNEWVPIRQADYTSDIISETGYTFGIDHAATIVSGAFYTGFTFTEFDATQLIAVYPEGTEDLSGPVKLVEIPASAIAVTGSGVINIDSNPISWTFTGGNNTTVGASYDVTRFSQALFGKRILDIRVKYVASSDAEGLAAGRVALEYLATADTFTLQDGFGGDPNVFTNDLQTISIGDLNPFWAGGSTASLNRVYPWRYQELANLATTNPNPNRLVIQFRADLSSLPGSDVTIALYGLDVIFCEEKRILYGGDRLSGTNYAMSENFKFVQLRDTAYAIPGSTAAGRYTVTQRSGLIGFTGPYPTNPPPLKALRELYQLPPQRGLRINYTTTVDEEFTKTASSVLPEITLHTGSAVVTGVHPYGVQADIPVYGTVTAIQEIEDDPAGSSKSYPQVRFYARRFGKTTAPLRLIDVATGTQSVSITPEELDAQPEIVDGWREVTLRFTNPPSFATAAGDVDWRWDAVGELASNQWQVLGASTGPAPTGGQITSPATYYAPLGDSVNLTWQTVSPPVSGTAADTLSDAVLIFSTDPPAVTGIGLTTCSQTVTGIGLDCGSSPGCIPTGIAGVQLAWGTAGTISDTFSRTVAASSWGTADSGQTWSATIATGGSIQVSGGLGLSTTDGANESNYMTVTAPSADMRVDVQFITPVLAAGDTIIFEALARFTNTSNYYSLQALADTAGKILLRLSKVVAGVTTVISPAVNLEGYAAGQRINVEFYVAASTLYGKAWSDYEDEPAWQVYAIDTSLTTAGSVGVRMGLSASSTNAPITLYADNFCAYTAALSDGSVEIQRYDSVDGFWSTVVDTPNICLLSWCDYEARVGVQSIYRIRTKNALEFASPWASGAATLAAPGVFGAGAANSVLIFTSNKNPASNLAYIMQWEGTPIEAFAFPEAELVQFQRMYGRDFQVAFHPLERGGEVFERLILVQAAAITPESLAGFQSLRDLAWADLPYVCVRDELGNRWYANIRVPSGNVRRDRRIRLAQIQVTEVSATPCAVDP